LCTKGDHAFAPGRLFQDRFGLGRPIAEQVRGGHDAYVHTLVLEQHEEGITPGIAVGQELVDRGTVLPGVLVPGLSVPRQMASVCAATFRANCSTSSSSFITRSPS
jgi:hypothetical protein